MPTVPMPTVDDRSGRLADSREPAGPPIPAAEPCPACGHTGSRVVFSSEDRLAPGKAEHHTVECTGCRLMRLSPWPKAAEIRKAYPEGFWLPGGGAPGSRIEEYYRRWMLRDHLHFSREVLSRSPKGPLLELAARGGEFLSVLKREGRPVVSLEFDLQAATAALHQRGVSGVCGSLARAPFAPASFAAIAMFQVLEHLFDPAGHLQEAGQLLKPGGRLIIQVPNASCWQLLLFGPRWAGLDAPRHLIHYRAHDLELLLDRCGFAVERVKHFSLNDNPHSLVSTLFPDLDPETRRLRGRKESARKRSAKDIAYGALCVAALPFTIVEAACRAGSTILVEARRKDQ